MPDADDRPRVTVNLQYDIDRELHRRLKMAAAARDVTIKALVIEAIDDKVRQIEQGEPKKKPRKRR